MPPTAPQTGYAPVHGLELYYEIHGRANPAHPPLVLIHGGGDTIQTSFGRVLPELARDRQVIAFEQQGFGHTADIPDRPFSFEQSADDTVALLEYLRIKEADFLGFSNGGTIALQIAIHQPQLVHKLIVASAFFSRDCGSPEFWKGFENANISMMPPELREAYVAIAPHPENFQSFFEKGVARMRAFKAIPVESIRKLMVPTLVLIGDKDVVRPEHAVELYQLLPHGQLAILPASDHGLLAQRSELVVKLVNEFLKSAPAR